MGAQVRTTHRARSGLLAVLPIVRTLALLAGFASMCVPVREARADNAAFALAPRDASLALDARKLSEILVGDRSAAVRPVLEAVVGTEMLRAFDVLAQRSGTASERAATEIFSGRVAFFLNDGTEADRELDDTDGALAAVNAAARDASWVLALEADDSRCERVLRLFGARITQPGRYESPRERLSMARLGGWLLLAPSSDAGRASLERAVARVPQEDANSSLLGEPLVQELLASDAPVRLFLRHDAPIGGATTVALREARSKIFAEIHGQYDASPLGAASAAAPLDAHLVRAFEDRAAMVVSNPSDGKPGASDLFWTALVPELAPSPAMRANLAGERLFVVGSRAGLAAPMLALAWRVEDAEQALADQDHLMRGVCCGLARALETPSASKAPEPDRGEPAPPLGPGQMALLEMRRCADYGAFVDRFLGKGFKLGGGLLCWATVTTPCGGWQVYASDPTWLGEVSDRLAGASCSDEPRPRSAGLGFCDGPRAAALLRRWQPLVEGRANAPIAVGGGAGRIARAPASERLAAGIGAVADALDRMGRMRFQYATPNARQVHLIVEFEPVGALAPGKRLQDAAPTSSEPAP